MNIVWNKSEFCDLWTSRLNIWQGKQLSTLKVILNLKYFHRDFLGVFQSPINFSSQSQVKFKHIFSSDNKLNNGSKRMWNQIRFANKYLLRRVNNKIKICLRFLNIFRFLLRKFLHNFNNIFVFLWFSSIKCRQTVNGTVIITFDSPKKVRGKCHLSSNRRKVNHIPKRYSLCNILILWLWWYFNDACHHQLMTLNASIKCINNIPQSLTCIHCSSLNRLNFLWSLLRANFKEIP